MNSSAHRPCLVLRLLCGWLIFCSAALGAGIPGIDTVFLIVMENHDWSAIKDSPHCPYINTKLLPQAAHSDAYYNPPTNHPSEPNYIWLISGTNFGIKNDYAPVFNTIHSTNHLAWLCDQAGVPWKNYAEDISGQDIPLGNAVPYVVRHVPFLFFANINTNLAYVTNHIRPYSELAHDLAADTVPRFCFITPNLTNDMHTLAPGSPSTRLQGDNWLAREIPLILNSAAYRRGGLILLMWDEGTGSVSDGPIGLVLLSPRIRARGYVNSIPLNHSDSLRSIQDILGVQPYLGDAANAVGLDSFFLKLRVEAGTSGPDGRHVLLRDALVGRNYRLESLPSTLTGAWTPVATRMASGSTVEFTDPTAGLTARFYRVSELP